MSILNLFLISEKVDHVRWLRSDKRSVHLTEVLKAGKGSVLDFAVENGPKGKGTVEYLDEHECYFMQIVWRQMIEIFYLLV